MPEAMDWRHAFYLATTGGAQALGIEDHVGTFDVGKSFDALLLDAQEAMLREWMDRPISKHHHPPLWPILAEKGRRRKERRANKQKSAGPRLRAWQRWLQMSSTRRALRGIVSVPPGHHFIVSISLRLLC